MTVDSQHLVASAEGRGLPEDWWGLGCALFERGFWGSAAGCFAKVVEAEPENARAWCNWGWCAHQLGDDIAACDRLLWAAKREPRDGGTFMLLAQVELTLGDVDLAVEAARRSVEFEPRAAANHVGYALALMNAGEWEKGWKEYEWRFEYKMPELLTRPYRLWRGERVTHLYIEGEQGFGDSIFALRWVSPAAEKAERVSLFVQKELYALVVEGLPENVRVYPMPRVLPVAVDAWVPMMSLPAALELGGPGVFKPYIVTVADRWMYFSGGQSPWLESKPFRVGIVWAGGPTHESGHLRDMRLADLLWLIEVPGVELHSLQVGAASAQFAELACHGLIRDRAPELTNFADTAKVLAGLDLLITVDTAIAHLAGAMGMPCWMMMNQRGSDFRWGRKGEATGWYPSIRIFRRELGEEWSSVVRRVETGLRELVG